MSLEEGAAVSPVTIKPADVFRWVRCIVAVDQVRYRLVYPAFFPGSEAV
jgi:hypothetical protein